MGQVDAFAALGDRSVYRVIEAGGEYRPEYCAGDPTFEREGGVCGKMALEMKRGAGFYSKAFETIGSRSNGALMASGRPYLSRT